MPKEALKQSVSCLSGGEKRRVATARALLSDSGIVLMDEPFAGLDEETKEKMIEIILEYRRGRTLLVVSHDEEDARLLGAEIIRISRNEG